jgi:hypothetical protein
MQWWEESWYAQKNIETAKMIKTYCPVCTAYLGERFEKMLFEGHCDECKATFLYSPGDSLPTACLDGKKSKKCDCSNCRNDREEYPEKFQSVDEESFDDLI